MIVATFNLTWCEKIKYVVIGLLYGCNAMRKLEISLKKILRMKKPVKIFVFLLFGKYKYFATVDLFVFHYKMVPYDMDVSEMSPKGNTV